MYLSSSKFIFSYVGLFPANWRKIFQCKQIISQVFILLLPLCKKRDLHNSVCLLVNLVTGNWCKYSKLLANLNCKSNFCLSLCISCYWLPFCKSSYWLTYTANLVIVYPGANIVIGYPVANMFKNLPGVLYVPLYHRLYCDCPLYRTVYNCL